MKKRLELKKDTLLMLTPDTLGGVQGGTSPLATFSLRVCRYATEKIAGAVTFVGTAIQNSKPADTTNISGRGECTA